MSENEPTFPVETRIESANRLTDAAITYLGFAQDWTERGNYAQAQRYFALAAENYESAAKQVRGALAQSKTDEDYASRKV